jgi:hypothetical protein
MQLPTKSWANNRKSSYSSTTSTIEETILLATMLPIPPRHAGYYVVTEKSRSQRLLAKCKRVATEAGKRE